MMRRPMRRPATGGMASEERQATPAGMPPAGMTPREPGAAGLGGSGGPAGAQPQAGSAGRDPTPEEQQAYDEFTGNLFSVAYERGTMERLRNLLRQSDNPVETIADVVAQMVTTVAMSAQENGIDLPASGVAKATAELVTDLAQSLPKLAGIDPISPEHTKGIFIQAMQNISQSVQPGEGGEAAPPAGPEGMMQSGQPPAGMTPAQQQSRPGLMGRQSPPAMAG